MGQAHSFWGRSYKGHYIHGHVDEAGRSVIKAQLMQADGGFAIHSAKSIHAAKCIITRHIRGSK